MNISLTMRSGIIDSLTHQPFCCNGVFFVSCSESSLVPEDEPSREVVQAYHKILSELLPANERSDVRAWLGNALEFPGHHVAACRFYGAVRVGDLIVVVAKNCEARERQEFGPAPIDGYFLATLRERVSSLMGFGLDTQLITSMPDLSEDGRRVFKELNAFRLLEEEWRNAYGKDNWLAVKSGTVVACGKTRDIVTALVQDQGIPPPVLFVPAVGAETVGKVLQFASKSRSSAR